MKDVFLGRVAMAFERKNHVADGGFVTLQCLIEAFALDDKMIGSFHFDTLIGQEAEGKKTAEGRLKAV